MSKVLTIMFTDIQGFTEKTSSISRKGLLDLLDKHKALLLPVVDRFRGLVVKTIGDALLVVFESPTNAVLAGIMMQENIARFNEGREEKEKFSIRIAISSGEVEIKDNDVFGEAVNLAARIEGITEPGEIFFTESVYLAMNKAEVPSTEIGYMRFKGIPEAVKVYRVIQDRNSASYRELIKKLCGINLPESGASLLDTYPEGRKRHLSLNFLTASLIPAIFIILILGITFFNFIHTGKIDRKIKTIRSLISDGKLACALSLAEELWKEAPSHPGSIDVYREAIEARIKSFVENNEFEQAESFLEKISENKPWLDFFYLKKMILLPYADYWHKKGNAAATGGIYQCLLDKSPDDKEVLKHIVERLGAGNPQGSTILGMAAAARLAELTEGPLENQVGRTLLDDLLDSEPFAEEQEKLRNILINRYPASLDIAAGYILSDDILKRTSAFSLLKAASKISDTTEITYHILNLATVPGTSRRILEESLSTLASRSKKENWEEYKKNLGLSPFADIAALHEWGELAETVGVFVARYFKEEAKDALLKMALEGESFITRVNSYRTLARAGLLEELDEFKYWANILAIYEPSFFSNFLEEGIQFFESKLEDADRDRAKEALEKGLSRALEMRDEYRKNNSEDREKEAIRVIERFQRALLNFR